MFFQDFNLFLEPFSLWISLNSFINPFKGLILSNYSRSMIVQYLLHLEQFLIIYITLWKYKFKFTKCPSTYIHLIIFILLLLFEIIPINRLGKYRIHQFNHKRTKSLNPFPIEYI